MCACVGDNTKQGEEDPGKDQRRVTTLVDGIGEECPQHQGGPYAEWEGNSKARESDGGGEYQVRHPESRAGAKGVGNAKRFHAGES
mmetsp:Transcript_136537/g.291610  ORF Transcript_136537/g.291610 Transcript_136537/m.291610 type:complete len:86 (+) Transcript_136537:213-470(+)